MDGDGRYDEVFVVVHDGRYRIRAHLRDRVVTSAGATAGPGAEPDIESLLDINKDGRAEVVISTGWVDGTGNFTCTRSSRATWCRSRSTGNGS